MDSSRRDLFRVGAAALVSCCLPEALHAAGAPLAARGTDAARRALLDEDPLLTRSVLNGQLRTAFGVEAAWPRGRRLALTLVEVNDLPSAQTTGTAGSELCFAAIFNGPASAALPQRTYRLSHRLLGTFSVFLVPVGPVDATIHYEAIFNRLEA